ncbi:MAG: hypothetical protein SV186_04955 [Candidatus Nanohaloarchaea archaeon]|nr:hypothetical protein [Candidatus Nanohaloarchaea archaeon]
MHVNSVHQASVTANRTIDVPEPLQDAESVVWGRDPYRGYVLVTADTAVVDDDAVDVVAVGTVIDDARSVRPPQELRDRFEGERRLFWVEPNLDVDSWYVMPEHQFLQLVNE